MKITKLTKETKALIDEEVREEIETLDNMSIYGTPKGGYTRREQCAYIDGLKDLQLDFDTEAEQEAYKLGKARRLDIINGVADIEHTTDDIQELLADLNN